MTADLQNLSLATPFPFTKTIQTANGAGLPISHIAFSILQTPMKPLKFYIEFFYVYRICYIEFSLCI